MLFLTKSIQSLYLSFIIEKNCADLYKSGARRDGVYTVNPDGLRSFQVRCDMQTDGGGWTIFQRRQDSSVNFYRGWQDYKTGFGNLNGNFWLGLEKIHRLTRSGQNVLRVDLTDWTNDSAYAKYGSFSVASESNAYKMNCGKYSGKYIGFDKHKFLQPEHRVKVQDVKESMSYKCCRFETS